MKKIRISFDTVLCAVLTSLFFVSAFYLVHIILYRSIFWSFAFTGVMAVMYGVPLISSSKKEFIIKWILSVPLSFLFYLYFRLTNYFNRAFVWFLQDNVNNVHKSSTISYNELLSACNRLYILFATLFFVSLLAAFFIKLSKFGRFKKLQLYLCSTVGIMIVIAVIILESQLPANDLLAPFMQ